MFEKVVESVLEEYVSEWVEGLDSEKMKVALFAGKVEFRDLRMRGAALDKFQLPMKMKSGSVGRLTIKVPWKRLTSQGVKIQVENVFLVVQPTDPADAGADEDDDSYLLRTRWAKQQEVRMLEILEKVKSDGAAASDGDMDGAGDSDPTASWGYKKKILNTIMDNVSFEFTNIHIRYEDTKHVASTIPLALGLTIDSIIISTTNANGQEEFVDRAQARSAFVHRRLEMIQASVYGDNIEIPVAKDPNGPSRSGSNIIHPFSTKINLARNHDERTASTIPKLRCSAEISAIRACLNPQQSTFLIGIADFISAHEMYLKRLHFKRKRPNVSIRSNGRVWWQYAMHGVKELHLSSATNQRKGITVPDGRPNRGLSISSRRCDWKLFATLWCARKEYIRLHKNMLRAAKKKKLDVEGVLADRSRIHQLEDILDVQTIVFFRLCAARELELENQGNDSPRKLTQWKAKWSSGRTSSGDSAALSSTQRDGLLDKLGIYLTVSERMQASSEARSVNTHEERNVEALLMALDIVVISYEVVLVEEYRVGDKADTRDFLRFELNEFVVTILQRTSSSTVSSRITSIQILDFRQTYELAALEKKEPQALLSMIDSTTSSRKNPFVELNIDSSESKFRLDCVFERFRYIHNLYATSKLRAYFIAKPEMTRNTNKQTMKKPTLPVEKLRKTSIENAFGVSSGTSSRRNSVTTHTEPVRDIEFSVKLPEVDIVVHTTDTSAEVEAKLMGTHFQNGATNNTFLLTVEGAEVFFLESNATVSETSAASLAESSGANTSPEIGGSSCNYRSRSTLMQKMRLDFHGEKLVEGYLVPKWKMACTAPPIHLSMSSKQYQQLLQASAEWKTPDHGSKESKVDAPSAPFVVEDERFNVCISIPQVRIGFEGAEQTEDDPTSTPGVSAEFMGLELDARDLALMARFSSVAQAAAFDMSSLTLLQRDTLSMKTDNNASDSLSKDNSSSQEPTDVTISPNSLVIPANVHAPDPVYDRSTGSRTRKLLELSGKTSVLLSSSDPLLGEIKIQQAAIYWNHELMVALVKSNLTTHNNVIATANSSTQVPAEGEISFIVSGQNEARNSLSRLALQVQIDRWFVFFSPKQSLLDQVSFELSGDNLRCDVSRLETSYLCTKLDGLGGIQLISSRLVGNNGATSDSTGVDGKTEEKHILLLARSPITAYIESAGYGALAHRGGAANYFRVEGADTEVNYFDAYWSPILNHVTKEIAAFSLWTEIIKMPTGRLSLNERMKLEMEISSVRINIPTCEKGTSDGMEINIRHVVATSREFAEDSALEQNGIHIGGVQVVTCIAEAQTAENGDIDSSADEDMINIRRCCLVNFNDVFVEHVSISTLPTPLKAMNDQEVMPDFDDVLKKLHLMCSQVKVSLSSRDNWVTSEIRAALSEESEDVQQLQDASATTVALNPFQVELISRILNNNFTTVEQPTGSESYGSDQQKVTDVQIHLGDMNLELVDPQETTSSKPASTALVSSGGAIARFCIEQVQLVVNNFASHRSQYRCTSSKAFLWKVDYDDEEDHTDEDDCGDCTQHQSEIRTLCGNIYSLATNGHSKHGIDMVIDQRPPSLDCALPPKELHLHFDTCALLPTFVEFGQRLRYFASIESELQDETKTPLDVSVTTGFVHLLAAECLSNPMEEHGGQPAGGHQQLQYGVSNTLKMICSGCVIGRYTTGEPDKTCAQLYGRNMSVKVTSQWPPELCQSAASVAPFPQPESAESPPKKPHDAGSASLDSLAQYHRTICEDFTIDVDTVTTDDNDSSLAVTLTHFHAVVCTLDLFLMAQAREALGVDDGVLEGRTETEKVEEAGLEVNTEVGEAGCEPVTPRVLTEEEESVEEISSEVQVLLEDTSLTLLRQSGPHFSPIARVYSCRAMCKVTSEMGAETDGRQPTSTEVIVQFSDESFNNLSSDIGVSIWGFNASLGSWEPIVEPWTFALTVSVVRDEEGEMTVTLNFDGKEDHPLNLNMSPAMVDALCLAAKEYEGALDFSQVPLVPRSNIISSDCYLINDTGAPITYWVTHDIGTASRGFTYASRQKPRREILPNRDKVPLELMTSISPSLRAEQTVSFCWDDSKWHPLTDIPIRNTGKYVYAVRPNGENADPENNGVTPNPQNMVAIAPPQQVLYALLDISAAPGCRTFTISSQVRLLNETNVVLDCGILDADGKTITDIGTIEPKGACSVPLRLVPQIWSVRVFVKPHVSQPTTTLESSGSTTLTAPSAASTKEHRWSNELFICEKETSILHTASCSLVLDDYACKCQRMLDGTIPFHPSQTCKASGSYFHAYNRVFTSSNSSSLQYAQMKLMSPLTLVNNCGVPIFAVMFALKKVQRTAGASQVAHLVSSLLIQPRSRMDILSLALQDETYCSISMTGSSWSKLFRIPSAMDPQDGEKAATTPVMKTVSPKPGSEKNNIVLSLADFRSRIATLDVSFDSKETRERNAGHFMIVQPRFLLRNSTALPLEFSPQIKFNPTLPGTKSMITRLTKTAFSPTRKKAEDCCGSKDLEIIHSKLNSLPSASTQSTTEIASDENEQQTLYYSEDSPIMIQLSGNSQQSSSAQDFSLEVGANTSLRVYNEAKKRWHDIVALFKQVDGSHSTEVTFVERYLLLNQTDHELLVCAVKDIALPRKRGEEDSSSRSDKHVLSVAAHSRTEYSWSAHSSVPSDPCIRLKIRESTGVDSGSKPTDEYQWSGKFSLHDVSETALKVSTPNASRICVLRVQVRVEAAVQVCVVVTSEDVTKFPLYRIINSCAKDTIWFKQVFDGVAKEVSAFQRGVTQCLAPGESICFGWDEAFFLGPLSRELSVWYAPLDGTASSDYHSSILFDQPGESQQVEIPSKSAVPSASKRVYIRWHLHGVTKTMVAQDMPLTAGRKQRASNRTRQLVAAKGEAQRAPDPAVTSEIVAHLRMPQLSLSLVTSQPDELMLFSAQDVDIAYANINNDHDQCEIKIGCFQLDNQLSTAIFPVVIAPIITKKSGCAGFRNEPSNANEKSAETRSPQGTEIPSTADESGDDERSDLRHKRIKNRPHFLHVSVLRLSYDENVDYIKYFSAMLQPASIQIDDVFLLSLAAFVTDCSDAYEKNYPSERRRLTSETSKVHSRRSSRQGLPTSSERRIYIETMQLHPVKIQLSLTLVNHFGESDTLIGESPSLLRLPIAVTKALVSSTLSQIDSATLYLNALHLNHAFATGQFLASTVQQHYVLQGLRQLYSLVGAADILGNPVGLVTNLGVGVKDFFYEPVAGLVTSPQEFVLGLSRGTASLFTHSLYGAFNAASKVTGTLSEGLATLSLDREYLAARRAQGPRKKVATHVGTGLIHGTKQLGQGIFAGVTGVLTAPAQGAINGGLTGFIEGVGKGLIGVAVKPAAGVLDLAATTAAGITATTSALDRRNGLGKDVHRRREPRLLRVASDQRVRVYTTSDAFLSQLLLRLPPKMKLQLPNELYDGHLFLPNCRALVATSLRLLLLEFASEGTFASLTAAITTSGSVPPPQVIWSFPVTSLVGAQHTPTGVAIHMGSGSAGGEGDALEKTGDINTVSLSDLEELGTTGTSRVLSFLTDLVVRHQRATATSCGSE